MKKVLKISLVILVIFILLVGILFLWPARTPPFRNPDGSIPGNSIASLERILLGGVEQAILIRGRDKARPLVLFIHGGPGMPMMFLAYKFQKRLEDHFLVAHWDQRGAGKSYSKKVPVESMNVEQILTDTHHLILYLKKRFGKRRIYVVGHSWGSYIGIITAWRRPELLHAFIGMGQVVDSGRSGLIQDEFIQRRSVDTDQVQALEDLKKFGADAREKWLFRFGAELHGETNWFILLKTGLFSPEYSLSDVLKVGRGSGFSSRHMKYNAIKGSIYENIDTLQIPVYFFTGRYDYTTPFPLIEEFYRKIDAPLKKMVWFEQSAHFPFFEEPDNFTRQMLMVLKETHPEY